MLVATIGRHQQGCIPSDDLIRRVPEQRFGASVPTEECPIQPSADHRVVGRFDDRGQQSKGLFRFLAFRDVFNLGHGIERVAGTVPHHGERYARPHHVSAAVDVAPFRIHAAPWVLQQPLSVLEGALQIVGVHQGHPRSVKQFPFRISQHPAKGRVHLEESPVQFAHTHTALCVLKHLAESIIAFLKLALGADALADIAGANRNADDLAAWILDRGDGDRNIDGVTVLCQSDGIVTVELPGWDLGKSLAYSLAAIGRHQNGIVVSDDLIRRIPEQHFGALVQSDDGPIQRSAQDGVVGRFDERGQQSARLFGIFLL